MSKSDVISSLKESATRRFAQYGYDGTSLREIAADAGASLSAIHAYFGSKDDLFQALGREALVEVSRERKSLLTAAMRSKSGRVQLSDIIHSLAYPVMRRSLSTPSERNHVLIIREWVSVRYGANGHGRSELLAPSRFVGLTALAHARPELTWHEVIWAYSFIIGTIWSLQITDNLYGPLLGATSPIVEDESPAQITANLVTFCCGGIEAAGPAQRRPTVTRSS